MTGNEVRAMFIRFFESKGHTHVASSSLVPHDDPTLLFTNAGMNQFKDVFLGLERRPYSRATTSQKCVRAGGKHNDLDAVGRTARHQTFFEMLGNFSFGDYFKKEALAYAWELVTSKDWFGLDPERLWVSIYKDDDEAYDVWVNHVGVRPERVVRLGEEDNFWQMGDTGPCGPCSEIFIDLGEAYACGPDCALGQCDCDRWREFWNCVFMQYDRAEDGTLTPLERKGVDTGMGLERMTAIMQGVYSNYDTDLFRSIIAFVEELSGKTYDPGEAGLPFRVIADHARACTFLIADGVRFANEGRGYVMRRILRRAVRFGQPLGLKEPFMHRVVEPVVATMGEAYPELVEKKQQIIDEIAKEERRFFVTLEEGMRRIEEIIAQLKAEGKTTLPGRDAFTLYDTYGFPFDIAEDIALEHGLTVDEAGFEAAMQEQRDRARAARSETYGGEALRALADALAKVAPTRFVGYTELSVGADVVAVLSEAGERINGTPGDQVLVVLDQTPFYAEAGGQVGDAGWLEGPGGLRAQVTDCKKLPSGHYLHEVTVVEGLLQEGQGVRTQVDVDRRRQTAKNHTATHLLHAALRTVLGTQVQQAGSLVSPERLRFDFTFEGPVAPEQLAEIEALVQAQIEEGRGVETLECSLEQAKELGAMALFGEKYGERVRVVSVGDFSKELCGGTHVSSVSEIGLFTIVSETGVGAGVRRIEALTGPAAIEYFRQAQAQLAQVAEVLHAQPETAADKAAELMSQLRKLEKELAAFSKDRVRRAADELLSQAQKVGDLALVVGQLPATSMEELRDTADYLRDRLGSGVVVLGAAPEAGKVNLVAVVTKDLAGKRVHAGKLIGQVAKLVGGGGGGRPDMAQAGGKQPERLGEALAQVAGMLS